MVIAVKNPDVTGSAKGTSVYTADSSAILDDLVVEKFLFIPATSNLLRVVFFIKLSLLRFV